jgi:hypothetical protein
MEKKEILEVFKQAEIDWSKEYNRETNKYVDWGLCRYFGWQFDFTENDIRFHLQPYLFKYVTTPDRAFHFNNRQERLEAIRKVINELEKE